MTRERTTPAGVEKINVTATQKDKKPSKQEVKARLAERFIKAHIIKSHASLGASEETALAKMYSLKSAEEKASELYQKVIVYMEAVRGKNQVEVDPKLISRIKILASDPEVIKLMPATYGQARVEQQQALNGAGLTAEWQVLQTGSQEKKKRLEDLRRGIFQESFTSADSLEEAKHEMAELAEVIHENESAQHGIEKLTDRDLTTENTDAAAMIQYEKYQEYSRQMEEEGFVWLPSRVELFEKALKIIESGDLRKTRKGVFFISEPGSGKTALIRAIARLLTRDKPVTIDCGSQTGEPDFVGHEKVFPGAARIEQGTYKEYDKTATGAWTGYDASYEETRQRPHARILELNEFPKIFGSEKVFSLVKNLMTLSDGDEMPGSKKTVLPGRVLIGSGNVGAHHNNPPMPPALEREFKVIPVDYAEMSSTKPELYNFMVSALLKKGALPPIRKGELKPAYQKKDIPEKDRTKLSDGSTVVAVDEIIADPANREHGFLYRLAHAVKAVQNSYMARGGENPYIDYTKRDLLRLKTAASGAYVDATGDQIIVGTTITPDEIYGWITGYVEETKKKNAQTLTEWIQSKLEEKITSKHEDEEKLRAIFKHFHLLDKIDRKNLPPIMRPLTPKEIGGLSPDVPRPVHVEREKMRVFQGSGERGTLGAREKTTKQVSLESGATVDIEVGPISIGTESDQQTITVGKTFRIETGVDYSFEGLVKDAGNEHDGKLAGQLINEQGLFNTFTVEQVDRGVFVYDTDKLLEDVNGNIKKLMQARWETACVNNTENNPEGISAPTW